MAVAEASMRSSEAAHSFSLVLTPENKTFYSRKYIIEKKEMGKEMGGREERKGREEGKGGVRRGKDEIKKLRTKRTFEKGNLENNSRK